MTEQHKYIIFNENIIRLLEDLQILYPNDKDYSLFGSKLNILVKSNFKKPLILFYENITQKYRNDILNKNELFFLNNSFNESLKNTKSIQLLLKLKQHWCDISIKNKKIIWDYLHVLVLLSIQCVEV
jgi:hypothetical protein